MFGKSLEHPKYKEMDKIKIIDQVVFANHGLKKEENVLGQKFLISTTLYLNIEKFGIIDQIESTINYSKVCNFIQKYFIENQVSLIETIAQKLARELLTKFPMARKVRVIVKKPWAPIGLMLETVEVDIKRRWHTAYISLGSNIGDRTQYLENATKEIAKSQYCKLITKSDIIETKAYGVEEQADFLNQVVEIETLYSPIELLDILNEIEKNGGRKRIKHWGPRTIDLDILFYDKKVINTERLIIPHNDLCNREFVLKPMCQVNKDYVHPVLKKSILEIYQNLSTEKKSQF